MPLLYPQNLVLKQKSGNVNKGHSPVGSGNDLRSRISFGSARVVPEFDAKRSHLEQSRISFGSARVVPEFDAKRSHLEHG